MRTEWRASNSRQSQSHSHSQSHSQSSIKLNLFFLTTCQTNQRAPLGRIHARVLIWQVMESQPNTLVLGPVWIGSFSRVAEYCAGSGRSEGMQQLTAYSNISNIYVMYSLSADRSTVYPNIDCFLINCFALSCDVIYHYHYQLLSSLSLSL